ncbi:unnamed protein product [Linum tenue]|uniref:Stigma-specific Stig1 family protein n=1 Tax=Linum tenue TaxID=586396 RepID=A0AAV0H595_9ROSI|nr:unnamed protein product [Linum tenue]
MATALMKTILLIFVATALSVTLTMRTVEAATAEPSQRLSRFLKEEAPVDGTPGYGGNSGNGGGGIGQTKNPRAADHCNKEPGLCQELYGKDFECCNNKCINVAVDKQNCGACKNKCAFKDECCGGQCVYLSLDKRHCGKCNAPCASPQLCVYGMCNYP